MSNTNVVVNNWTRVEAYTTTAQPDDAVYAKVAVEGEYAGIDAGAIIVTYMAFDEVNVLIITGLTTIAENLADGATTEFESYGDSIMVGVSGVAADGQVVNIAWDSDGDLVLGTGISTELAETSVDESSDFSSALTLFDL